MAASIPFLRIFPRTIMITKRSIEVEHVRIETAKSFTDVRGALERNVPQLDPALVKALAEADVERASRERKRAQNYPSFRHVIMGRC
jgi:hypothetical protein